LILILAKLNFQHHYSSRHMILQKSFWNMMIWCSSNIYYYYESWKPLCRAALFF